MKKFRKLICFVLCAASLAGISCMNAGAAPNKAQAYSAYYDLLLSEEESIGQAADDRGFISTLDPIDQGRAWRNASIDYAYLYDLNADGVEELIMGKTFHCNTSGEGALSRNDYSISYVYTFDNGELKRVGHTRLNVKDLGDGTHSYYEDSTYVGEPARTGLYVCYGTNGKTYLASNTPNNDIYVEKSMEIFSLTGTAVKKVADIRVWFGNLWYIDLHLQSSYGTYYYDFNGETLTDSNEYLNRLKTYNANGYEELVNNDYKQVMNKLAGSLVGTFKTPSSWAKAEVDAVRDAGYLPACVDRYYTKAITRKEFCKLTTAYYESVFGEIKELKYFSDTDCLEVSKMAGLGVVDGTGGGKFTPDKSLNRQEAATILARLGAVMGQNFPKADVTYADKAQIASWAIEQVGQMNAAGIMNGVDGNKFAPKKPYTREQSILTIGRFAKTSQPVALPITLDKTEMEIMTGGTFTLTASSAAGPISGSSLKWTSSNPSVATVTNGQVKAYSAGQTVITATTDLGESAQCTVKVVSMSTYYYCKTPQTLSVNECGMTPRSVVTKDAATIRITSIERQASYQPRLYLRANASIESVKEGLSSSTSAKLCLPWQLIGEDGSVVDWGYATAFAFFEVGYNMVFDINCSSEYDGNVIVVFEAYTPEAQ